MSIDVERLAHDLAAAVERHGVPGVQVGVRTAVERHVVSAGVVRAGGPDRVGPGTRFHAGSLAKALTGQWVSEAAAQGLLDLDVPCSDQGTTSWDDTPRMLLTQTSGRPNELPEAGEDLVGFVSRIGALPRQHHPGRFSYCNAGWSVLDLLLRERTGAGFADRLRADTLGTLAAPAGAALGHSPNPEGAPVEVRPMHVEAAAAAGGCWWASADDLLDLAERHLDPQAHGLDRDVVEQLRAPAAGLPGATVFDAWGHGWASWSRGEHEAFGWAGFTDGHRAYLRCFPREDAALVVLTNCAGGLFGGPGGAALFDDVLPTLLDRLGVPPLPDPAASPARWSAHQLAGQYGPAPVTSDGEDSIHLGAQAFGGSDLVLDRVWGDTFEVRGRPPGAIPVAFDADAGAAAPEWLYLGPFAVPRVG